jgi:DNA-binding MarR family transcriptional regulator
VTQRRNWLPGHAILNEVYSTGMLMGVLVADELEAHGISVRLFSFLSWVQLLEPVTPGELATETGMPATTIRDQIRELVERGDVRKRRNPEDGRSYLLELTAQGRRLAESGRPALRAALARLEPHLERPADEYAATAVELRAAVRKALAGTG